MKFLQDYMQEEQTNLFNQVGAFFAFNDSQFESSKQGDLKYTFLGSGMFCPTEHVQTLINGLDAILERAIRQDLAENGKDKIIERELGNYECFYTYNLEPAKAALSAYGFSENDIKEVFKRLESTQNA